MAWLPSTACLQRVASSYTAAHGTNCISEIVHREAWLGMPHPQKNMSILAANVVYVS